VIYITNFHVLNSFNTYIGHINPSKNAYARRGFSLALGLINFKNIREYLEPAIDALIISATIQVCVFFFTHKISLYDNKYKV
jgi:hypothetical protein